MATVACSVLTPLPLLFEFEFFGWPMWVTIAVLAVVSLVADSRRSRKEVRRYREVRAYAERNKLPFVGDKARPKPDLTRFQAGVRQYTINTIVTSLEGREVQMGDYHYQKEMQDRDGSCHVSDYYFSYAHIRLPAMAFPELTIRPEGFVDKAFAVAGFEDINFESHEFSKKYHVHSSNRKFAYDVLAPQMMEYLLKQPGYTVLLGRTEVVVLLGGGMRCPVEEFLPAARFLVGLVDQIPAHVWDAYKAQPSG